MNLKFPNTMRSFKSCIFFLSAVIALSSSSCKKGEDDPFISFRTRTARMEGEWKVVSASYRRAETGPGAENYSWTFDGSRVIENDNGVETTIERNWTWKIRKDGTLDITDVVNGDVQEVHGRWDFLGGVGEVKRKSRIMLLYERVKFTGTGTYFVSSSHIDESYDLIELRNNRMVWRYSYTSNFSNGLNRVRESEIVFEAKK